MGSSNSTIKYEDFEGQNYLDIKTRHLKSNKLFIDEKFPPKASSLQINRSQDIEWKRAKELAEHPDFFIDGISTNDVFQGELGNCWFVATVASLTLNEKLFVKSIPQDQSFDKTEYAGIFHFRFWKYGKWIDVVVDDYLPTRNGKLIFAHSKSSNEFWLPLLEKAYAKFYGSYGSLKGGNAIAAMVDFSGGFSEETYTKNVTADELFITMTEAFEKSSLMTCSTSIVNESLTGLMRNHVYTITRVFRVKTRKGWIKRKIITKDLLEIRNPWGKAKWIGNDAVAEFSDRKKRSLGISNETEGGFYILMEDFIKNFDAVQIVSLTPDSLEGSDTKAPWHMKQFYGSWIRSATAGGCINHKNTFSNNPQFLIKLQGSKNEYTCVIGLTQKTAKHAGSGKIGSLQIGFAVYSVEKPDDTILPLDKEFCLKNSPEAKAGFTNKSEISGRFHLKPGHYVIIPSTFNPDVDGEFLLRIFSEKVLTTTKYLCRFCNQYS